MKEIILEHIYQSFRRWASSPAFACRPGCANCCTDNVTITALEAQRIAGYCRQEKQADWLLEKLATREVAFRPQQTTNEYVQAILAGETPLEETPLEETQAEAGACVFLESGLCSIYPVRPFSCRCFVSTTVCSPGGSATVPDAHLYGAMAAMQLIEHLGQFAIWGNMTDVLAVTVDPAQHERRRKYLRQARVLPGFAIPEEHADSIAPFLETLFSTRIGARTIEQILNGG